jgi:hypothetical protein
MAIGMMAMVVAGAVMGGSIGQAPPPGMQLDPGVTLRVYHVDEDLAAIPKLVAEQTPNFDELRPTIDFRDDAGFGKVAASFLSVVSGWVIAGAAGEYEFKLTSDDGARLSIDGKRMIDHDGRHGATPKTSGPVTLTAGMHALLVEHFDHGGKKQLTVEWKTPGATAFMVIPTESLRTEKDLTRVTSPGSKKIDDGKRPGDGKPVAGVHPAWTVTTIRPQGFEPMVGAMCFDAAGRLIVGTFNPLQRDDRTLPDIDSKKADKLFAISGATGDPSKIEVKECADGFYEPLGLCAVGDDLYVSNRRSIVKLSDKDHDGYYETHEIVAEGWEGWNYHQFCFGLVYKEGKLYATLSTAMAPPGWEGMGTNAAPNGPMRGGVLEVDLSSNTASVIAGGLRAPNGIGIGPENSLWYLDNQGAWMPCSQFCEVIAGRFYGHHNRTNFVPQLKERFPEGGVASVFCDRPRTPASVLMPHNEAVNSPTQPQLITSGLYAGQMYIGELTGGGIRRAFLERVNGQWQGALFQFTQGLESGVNRMIWGPDGSLYVGGIGAGGDWNWRGTKFGLQRLTPSGKTAFEMFAIHATPTGFDVEFTKPVANAAAWLGDAANFTIKQWRYEPTEKYGGPKVDVETLKVTRATPSSDGKRVTLEIAGLKRGRCVSLRMDPTSVEGEPIWSTEAWYTLNEIPRAVPPVAATINGKKIDPEKGGVGVGVLPPASGVTLIGASADPMFRKGSQKELPRDAKGSGLSERTDEDLMKLPGYVEIAGTGDLVTGTVFGDARLHVEWLSPPGGEGQMGGNSGVYLQGLYEIQILNTPAAETLGRAAKDDEAGSIYKVKAPDVNASTGPGTWQAYDIWFKAPRFENGKKKEDARVSVYWNGVLVHNDVAIKGPTGAKAAAGENAVFPVQTGPLRLQDHETKAEGSVRFRNVWIAPLEDVKYIAKSAEWEMPFDTIGEGGLPKDWVVRGGQATFRMDGKELVGTSAPKTTNTFLVSRREYDDFELLVDFKADPQLNSGVQIRSEVLGGVRPAQGAAARLAGGDRSRPGAGVHRRDLRGERTRVAVPAHRCAVRAEGVPAAGCEDAAGQGRTERSDNEPSAHPRDGADRADVDQRRAGGEHSRRGGAGARAVRAADACRRGGEGAARGAVLEPADTGTDAGRVSDQLRWKKDRGGRAAR